MYKAIVSAITVRPHGNAHSLQLGLVHGHQVVVGLDVKDGDVGVFFPCDGQLSDAMCRANHLYSESAALSLGIPPSEVPKFGFFSEKRRVRAQKFRGEKSDGFWVELDSLAWTGIDVSVLSPGDMIDELNGKVVCEKYFTPATLRAMKGGTPKTEKLTSVIFPKHVDTAQFRYFVGGIPKGSLITITEKIHGTSGRYGHVLESRKLVGWRRVLSRLLGRGTSTKRWVHLNGSRNVTLLEDTGPGFYGSHEFRYDVTKNLSLHKGEIVYFEIVGWVNETTPIMPPHPIDDKEVKKKYGAQMSYTYGCPPGVHALYVYRITRLNEDGVETELSWTQTKLRARELGLQVVPEVAPAFVYDGKPEGLEETVGTLMEGDSTLDARHIREGVVLRIEGENGTTYLKSKQWLFGILEGYLKDDETSVDLEESS